MSEETRKRRHADSENHVAKRSKDTSYLDLNCRCGKIIKIFLRNFMCHDALEVLCNQNINFIIGRNGSGKSAILTALTVGLGARANVTNRGVSAKEFVKKGKHSATIEITLSNVGATSFKHDLYGDTITVSRIIGSTSAYKIKNYRGDIISTKREELDHMLRVMNIQIDNPISILNQDVARTFLMSFKPNDRYTLFMKATCLNQIGENYILSEQECQEANKKFTETQKELMEARKEVADLEQKLELFNHVEHFRKETAILENELSWATAAVEEQKLQHVKENFERCKEMLDQYEDSSSNTGSKTQEFDTKIETLRTQITKKQQELKESIASSEGIKQKQLAETHSYSSKAQELRICQDKLKRSNDNIALLNKEIQRIESGDSNEQNERKKLKEELAEYQQQLDKIEAMLRTRQTDQMHLQSDKMHLPQQMHSIKVDMDGYEIRIRKIKQQLVSLKQQSNNALIVFGPNIPRLHKRIEEEHRKGRFRKKPVGPLGAFIKLKDPAWVPAVEAFLGGGLLNTFCVDNSNDANILNGIMEEVFLNERAPQIVASKFFDQVHNLKNSATRPKDYSNMFDAMEISHPVVANCLIDQRRIESILLIPTGSQAREIMSNASKVPANCKRAITQQGDTYFPDPNYKTYSGRVAPKARYLQVSTKDKIQELEEELSSVESERKPLFSSYTEKQEKLKRTNAELATVSQAVSKLLATQSELKKKITSLDDKIGAPQTVSVTHFRADLVELEKIVQHAQTDEERLRNEVQALRKACQAIESEIQRYKDLQQNIETEINSFQAEMDKLEQEKLRIRVESERAVYKVQKARQNLQNITAELEIQQRVVEKVVADATKRCERINTERSVQDLQSSIGNLKAKIRTAEANLGSKEELTKELKEKQSESAELLKYVGQLESIKCKHEKRSKVRKQLFEDMKKHVDLLVQASFGAILALRKYKGKLKIDHNKQQLHLEVTPENADGKSSKDVSTLSGGERSYATVAFILALWDCTDLPFYFLDEFDVFMDKVNRRTILDLLLDHAKSHAESQFGFLTPLDTSNISADDSISIHRLAPPERAGDHE